MTVYIENTKNQTGQYDDGSLARIMFDISKEVVST